MRGPPVLAKNLMRNIGKRDQLAWKHVELIRKRWKGKLVVKGLIAPADARIARESGVDGVLVSNHGGRQLDHTVSSLRTLPEIAAEADGMTVMVDGGIRRGTDVLKALALGADFVFVGRPFLYAAVIAGQAGVQRALTLLRDEVDRDMALLGIRSIRRDHVRSGAPDLTRAHALQRATNSASSRLNRSGVLHERRVPGILVDRELRLRRDGMAVSRGRERRDRVMGPVREENGNVDGAVQIIRIERPPSKAART